jgi:hypothetical protein
MHISATPAERTSRSQDRSDPLGRAERVSARLLAGPPLTTAQLARIVGMSPTFIREEIHGGYLRAADVGRGRKRVYRIPVLEAYRYIKTLGLL